MAAFSVVPKRQQRIAFRIVTRTVPTRDVITSCAETYNETLDAVSGFANKVDNLPVENAKSSHIGFMHKENFARTGDSAQTVLVTVDCGVELVVAANRDQR